MTADPIEPPEFLLQEPAPVGPTPQTGAPEHVLPEAAVASLMAIPGVDGVWIEHTPEGQGEVVIYVTDARALPQLPTTVEGLLVRPRVGEVIRALRK